MKKKSTLTILCLICVIFIASCSDLGTPQEEAQAPSQTQIDASSAHPGFTIKADASHRDAVSALYSAIYAEEAPKFVEKEADLLVVPVTDDEFDRGRIPNQFLPDVAFINQSDVPEVLTFIDFAISPQGQQVLIDAGELPGKITLTDQAGNSVVINLPVKRVISTYGPATSFIYSVDAENRLVSASYLGARDPKGSAFMEKIDPRFPGLMGDDYFTQEDFNLEQAAALDPDLIVTSARTSWLETAAQLNLSIFLFDAETPDRLKEAILLTGEIFGPQSSAYAEAWVAYYDEVINRVQSHTEVTTENEKPKVLFTGTEPLRVASGEMYQTDIINAAGGVSVSAGLSGYWNDVNLEQIVIWNPDVIIVPPYGGASVEAITESPEWQILDAVQAGRVYKMPKLVVPWDTPAPDSVLGIVWLAQKLHPNRLDVDCGEEAAYFYNTFYQFAISPEEIASICQAD